MLAYQDFIDTCIRCYGHESYRDLPATLRYQLIALYLTRCDIWEVICESDARVSKEKNMETALLAALNHGSGHQRYGLADVIINNIEAYLENRLTEEYEKIFDELNPSDERSIERYLDSAERARDMNGGHACDVSASLIPFRTGSY